MFGWKVFKVFMGRGGKCDREWRNHNHQSKPKEIALGLQGWGLRQSFWPDRLGSPRVLCMSIWRVGNSRAILLLDWLYLEVRLSGRTKFILWNYIVGYDALESNVWSSLIRLGLTINTTGSKKFELLVAVHGHYFVSYRKMEKTLETMWFCFLNSIKNILPQVHLEQLS